MRDFASNSEVVRETVLNIDPSIAAWDLGQGESQVLTFLFPEDGTEQKALKAIPLDETPDSMTKF